MTIDPLGHHVEGGGDSSAPELRGHRPSGEAVLPDPTAGMVLHRVLAMAARTFLLNDLDGDLDDEGMATDTVDARQLSLDAHPLWAQSAVESPKGTPRQDEETERVHQTRVSMRRIRSNLRSFRLLLDPGWGTALRGELAWYGSELGKLRDLDLLGSVVAQRGPEVLDASELARMSAVVDWQRDQVIGELTAVRSSPRRFDLTEQMTVLWEGPHFREHAAKPAAEVLPAMLHRTWRDLRGAARKARKDPSDIHLHRLRIRLKDLRYGAETLALVEGAPARKTAKAAERLQSKLGELHDAVFAIAWLEALAVEQPDLADSAERLVAVQRDQAKSTRKGWKRDLKEVERRWRRWQG